MMEHGSAVVRRVTPAESSPNKLARSGSYDSTGIRRGVGFSARLDVQVAGAFPANSARMDEKEQLRGLNDRFARFIDQVRRLEQHNHLLGEEIEKVRGDTMSPFFWEQKYGPERQELRKLVHDMTRQKAQFEIDHQNLQDQVADLRGKTQREALSRSDAEGEIAALKEEIHDAHQAKLQLDETTKCLVDELLLLKENHVADVTARIQQSRVHVEAGQESDVSALTEALRDIRAQLEGHAVCDLPQAGDTLRSQLAELTEVAGAQREALKAAQQEIRGCKKLVQTKSVELNCAKGTKEALERHLDEAEDHHSEEMIHYQNTIQQLENELVNSKSDMSGHLREHQDLFNVKMALDVEIYSYRKLLEGEETQTSSVSDTHISVPYIYHQSPVYTLPRLGQRGRPEGRAEPRYKFVEEIITETIREVEMAEFEETDGGGGGEECVKAEGGSSEAEEGTAGKDSGEGEKMSDGQQNQVKLVEKADSGDDVAGGEGPGEEPEETETVANTNSDKMTLSAVELTELMGGGGHEKHNEGAKSMTERKDSPAKVGPVQSEASSKVQDSDPQAPAEGEPLRELRKPNSEDDGKCDALDESEAGDLKDGIIDAKVEKLKNQTSVQEPTDSDKAREPSWAVHELEHGSSLVYKTRGETQGQTPGLQSSLPKEMVEPEKPVENEGQGNLSLAPMSEAKENYTEPKADGRLAHSSEEDMPNSSQNHTHSDPEEKDGESGLKFTGNDLSNRGDEKPNTEGKIQTTESPMAEEKTDVTGENKNLRQVSSKSQIQTSVISTVPGKASNPAGRSEAEEVKSKDAGETTGNQTERTSRGAEDTETKTSLNAQDISTLGLKKASMVNGHLPQEVQSKVENGSSNGTMEV